MAEALLAGVILPTFLDYLLEKMESADVLSFFMSHKLDEEILRKLKITMITAKGLLDDVEEKQMTKQAVKDWLDELKNDVYKAEDLLDEIAYKSLRSNLEPTKNKVGSFFCVIINLCTSYKEQYHKFIEKDYEIT